jgi:uncharacterized Zn-binding protein involved in type VI secretion
LELKENMPSKPAARVTDMHVCPMVTGLVPHIGGPVIPPCAITVITGNMIQARISDMCVCAGPPDVIAMGSATVLVVGLPAARILDNTAHGGVIVTGFPTVLIGDASSGGGGGGGGGAGGGGGGAGGSSSPRSAGAGSGGGAGNRAATNSTTFVNPATQAAVLKAAAARGTPFCQKCYAR